MHPKNGHFDDWTGGGQLGVGGRIKERKDRDWRKSWFGTQQPIRTQIVVKHQINFSVFIKFTIFSIKLNFPRITWWKIFSIILVWEEKVRFLLDLFFRVIDSKLFPIRWVIHFMPVLFLYSSLILNSEFSVVFGSFSIFSQLHPNSRPENCFRPRKNIFRDISWQKFKKLLADSTSIYKGSESFHFFQITQKRELFEMPLLCN